MNGPKPIAKLLGRVLPAAGDVPASPAIQRRLVELWRKELGAAGARSLPLLFTSGRLVVFAESAAWGNEIRHRAPSLQAALAGQGIAVEAIEVKTQPPAALPARKTKKPPRLFRLSKENAEHIQSLAATIDYPPLKRALRRLAGRGGGGEGGGADG